MTAGDERRLGLRPLSREEFGTDIIATAPTVPYRVTHPGAGGEEGRLLCLTSVPSVRSIRAHFARAFLSLFIELHFFPTVSTVLPSPSTRIKEFFFPSRRVTLRNIQREHHSRARLMLLNL